MYLSSCDKDYITTYVTIPLVNYVISAKIIKFLFLDLN